MASIGIAGATYQKFLVPKEIINKKEQHCIAQKDQFFGKPDPSLIEGLRIDLRPPKQVRKAYIDRHLSLLRLL